MSSESSLRGLLQSLVVFCFRVFRAEAPYECCMSVQENNLKYGFVISILELPKTIPALWETTQKFMKDNPGLIPSSNLMPFVTDRDGSYNLCHFWSNFEIGDLNFFRSRPYEEYFKALDRRAPHLV